MNDYAKMLKPNAEHGIRDVIFGLGRRIRCVTKVYLRVFAYIGFVSYQRFVPGDNEMQMVQFFYLEDLSKKQSFFHISWF